MNVTMQAHAQDQLHLRPGAIASQLQAIGRAATTALYDELRLDPKPGLVSFVDTGSHTDMNGQTFMRSLFALRHYFARIAAAGAHSAPFAALQTLGVAAEARMLRATAGINTHRGAIFTLGLLCASAGALVAQGSPLTPHAVRAALLERWGADLRHRCQHAAASNGQRAAHRYRLRSAGEEAMLGFPALFDITLPALRQARMRGLDVRRARLDALFHAVAVLADTNLAHRGGLPGLRFAQASARAFLDAGGAGAPDGVAQAQAIHRAFVARRLSPGGAADMLAAACLLDRLCITP